MSLAGRRRLTPALAGGAALFGGPLAALGALPSLALAPMLVGLSGVGRSLGAVAGNTLLQRAAPAEVLARVFGVLEGATMLGLAVGTVGASALVAVAGIGPALVAVGAFVPLVVAALWLPLRAVERGAIAPQAELLALARSLPIFSPLPAPALERILASVKRLTMAPGEVLLREGEPGDRCYLLAEGAVEIVQRGELVAVRRAPDIVGEIALVHDIPRTATVIAASPLVLYALGREPFLEAVTGHPAVRIRAEQLTARRIAGQA
ncbi:MAG: cyclic nucleotide-binding domain-containing protein [Chloroflexota bacterium]